jgi:uncharacterized membrane protein
VNRSGGKRRATAWGAGATAVAALALGARAWAVRRLSRRGRSRADDALELRVIERLATLPATEELDVLASAGRLELCGRLPADQAPAVIEAVSRTRGVRSIDSHLVLTHDPTPLHGSLVAAASVTVPATAARVFAFWSRPERLFTALRHLREVRRMGGDRYLFRAAAPGGPTLEWEVAVTRYVPDRLIAWRSTGGTLGHCGIVRLERARRGTLLSVRLTYAARDAEAAHSLTTLMGAVPAHDLGADLRYWRDLFESGKLDSLPTRLPVPDLPLPAPPAPSASGRAAGGGGLSLGRAALDRR